MKILKLLRATTSNSVNGKFESTPGNSILEPGVSAELMRSIDCAFIRHVHTAARDMTDDAVKKFFLSSAWKTGIDPSAEFSCELYLRSYKDIAKSGLNPLLHFIEYGRRETRKSWLSTWNDADATLVNANAIDLIDDEFDETFYRSQFPELAKLSRRALASHYLVVGWRSGADPSLFFSSKIYLTRNLDVAEAKENPFLHYLTFGKNENRSTSTSVMVPSSEVLASSSVTREADTIRPYFDPRYYRYMDPNIVGTDDELILHFLKKGWKEGRDPNSSFSVNFYQETYPDIVQNSINPFLHYILFGKAEGRRSRGNGPLRMMPNPEATITQGHLKSVMTRTTAIHQVASPNVDCDPGHLSIHWIIPDFARGGGGHMTIFRMVRLLEQFGHTCKIWIENPTHHQTIDDAWEEIVKYYQCIRAEVDFVGDQLFQAVGDAVIATGWSTAYLTSELTGFRGKYYFVQDHEVEFYPTGAESLLAKQSYSLDLACICASPWLDKIVSKRYGRWARHFHLAYDHEIYRVMGDALLDPSAKANPTVVKIAVYSRDHTARRCVPLVLMALEVLGKRRSDFEVHFFGQETLPFLEANFMSVNHGILDASGLASLYNKCDFGIAFSATNYSLVPQEMMACGLPLIELDTESTRTIFPSNVVTFAGPHPFDIAAKIELLIDNAEGRYQQAAEALQWVNRFTWELAARAVEAAILSRLGALNVKLSAPAISSPRETRIDVCIPTFNGMAELKPVVEALRQQNQSEFVQIHCVDSSSTDGTTEWLREQRDISLTVIPQSEFQHGKTRNELASEGVSEVIAFLTQDAVPANQSWAGDILNMFDHVKRAAGLTGKHLPYPHHPLSVKIEIERHFEEMLKYPLQLSKYTNAQLWNEGNQGWRQLLHFYSDNNSAMRRSVWSEIPYPEIDYGEDQVWANAIIEAGYVKIYAPTVAVFHSHDYKPEETYKRAKIESKFFNHHFGYTVGASTIAEYKERASSEQQSFRGWARSNGLSEAATKLALQNILEKHRGFHDGLK